MGSCTSANSSTHSPPLSSDCYMMWEKLRKATVHGDIPLHLNYHIDTDMCRWLKKQGCKVKRGTDGERSDTLHYTEIGIGKSRLNMYC
jgi:histidinol phosphatase-like PHP family hydrolase